MQEAGGRRQEAGKPSWAAARAVCSLWLVACSLLTGCIHRSLTIRTDPPGAMVYVNDQLKGESPMTYDFLWYGWYRLTLRKDGFERLDDRKLLRSPVYFWIPFDLAMELLPLPIRDRRTWSYTLTPTTELPAPLPPAITNPKSEQPVPPSPPETIPPAVKTSPTKAPAVTPTTTTQETSDDAR